MTRIIMHGSNGRMGHVIRDLVRSSESCEIVAGIDKDIDCTAEFPVYSSLSECKEEADVVIDFSNAGAIDGLLEECVKRGLPIVLCTTGLSEEQLSKVNEASKSIAILRSANMSLGVNLLMELVKEAARSLKDKGYDIEIVEKHHRHKLDAPSGTAIALADAAREGAKEAYKYTFDRSSERREREDDEIGFSAVRGGSITGEHDVIFAGMDEVITLSHQAYSRSIFAKGAISAAIFLDGKKNGLYTMQNVITESGSTS